MKKFTIPCLTRTNNPTGGATDHSVAYTYDPAGRLATVANATETVATYTYLTNAPSLLETVTTPSHKVVNTYEDDRNILAAKSNQYLDGSTISQYAYTVNEIGQRTAVEKTGAAFASSANTLCCLLYTSPSPRDGATSRMPSSA